LNVLIIDIPLSKTQTKKIDGISNDPEKIKNIPVYLLGQLGKNDEYLHKKTIFPPMEYILNIINEAVNTLKLRLDFCLELT
jgi:hypothetical protein